MDPSGLLQHGTKCFLTAGQHNYDTYVIHIVNKMGIPKSNTMREHDIANDGFQSVSGYLNSTNDDYTIII